MSDIFTVLLDLSHVKGDMKENQHCIVLVDITKMKFIYEFRHWITYLCSLEGPIEFFHDDAALHDLDDIRILSLLNIVQVKPVQNFGSEKDKEKPCSLKSVQYNEDHESKSHKLVPGKIDSNGSFTAADKDASSKIQLHQDQSGKSLKVLGYCNSKKTEGLSNMSLKTNEKFTEIKKSNDGLHNYICNKQQIKMYELENKIGMPGNLKKAILMQRKYYQWHTESNRHDSHDQHMNNVKRSNNYVNHSKPKTFKNLNFKAQHASLKCSTKLAGNVGNDTKCRIIYDDSEKGDKNDLKKIIHKGSISSSKLTKPADHLCNDKISCSDQFNYKGSASLLNIHAGVRNVNHTTAVSRKPLTISKDEINTSDSDKELNLLSKSLSVNDILKLLTKTAAHRSEQLSLGDIDATVKTGQKVKKFQSKTIVTYKDIKCRENLYKHKISKENHEVHGNEEKVESLQQSSKTGAPNPSFQHISRWKKKKNKPKTKTTAATSKTVPDNVTTRNCGELDKNQMAKADSLIKTKSTPGTSELTPLCDSVQKKKKNKPKTKTTAATSNTVPDNVTTRNCGELDKNQMAKAEGPFGTESKTRVPYSFLQNSPATMEKMIGNSNSNLSMPNISNVLLKKDDKLVPLNFETKQLKTVDKAADRSMGIKYDLNKPCASSSIVNQNTSNNHNIDSTNIKKSKGTIDVQFTCSEKNYRIKGDYAASGDEHENFEITDCAPDKISRKSETHAILFSNVTGNGNRVIPSFSKAPEEESVTQITGKADNQNLPDFSDIAVGNRNVYSTNMRQPKQMAAIVPVDEISKIRKTELGISNKYKHSESIGRVPEIKSCDFKIEQASFSRVFQGHNWSSPSSCSKWKQGKDVSESGDSANIKEKECKISLPTGFNESFSSIANRAAACTHQKDNSTNNEKSKGLHMKDECPIAGTINEVIVKRNEDSYAPPYGEDLTSDYQSNLHDRKNERHANSDKNMAVRVDILLESLKACWITVVIFIYLMFLNYLY